MEKNFNSHPHEEDDEDADLIVAKCYAFQLTSSRRG